MHQTLKKLSKMLTLYLTSFSYPILDAFALIIDWLINNSVSEISWGDHGIIYLVISAVNSEKISSLYSKDIGFNNKLFVDISTFNKFIFYFAIAGL